MWHYSSTLLAESHAYLAGLRFYLAGITLALPRHEEQPIAIGVPQGYEPPSPAFISRLVDLDSALSQSLMKVIHVVNSEDEVDAAAAFEHCFKLLDQSDAQPTCAHRSHRRFSFLVVFFHFSVPENRVKIKGPFCGGPFTDNPDQNSVQSVIL